MSTAEEQIDEIRRRYGGAVMERWQGYEQEMLIELVRALDCAAFGLRLVPYDGNAVARNRRELILFGAASALRPLLERVAGKGGGIPWAPTNTRFREFADGHLANCGLFTVIKRIAALERYGLATATRPRDNHLVLEVSAEAGDAQERSDNTWLRDFRGRDDDAALEVMATQKTKMAKKLAKCVQTDGSWFIRYEPTPEIMAYHREFADRGSRHIAEAEALAPDALIGGWRYRQWMNASVDAYGRVLNHIAFATTLSAKKKTLDLRNLLTVPVRKEDVAAVWEEAGAPREHVPELMRGMLLDARTAEQSERDHELPLPYYVELSKDFLLLTTFGGLMNPLAGVTWHLRRNHRRDWDTAVGDREARFRTDIAALFPSPKYVVPASGFNLRRSDGSKITDVDAVIKEEATGRLLLIQLKWPDLYGYSLAERNSRRLNLLKANEWVTRVRQWVDGRSANEVSKALGLGPAAGSPPDLLVLNRYRAMFTGEAGYDADALWASWPSFVRMQQEMSANGLESLFDALRSRPLSPGPPQREPEVREHRLPGLTVEIRYK